ncbi:MAG: hypothetical protein JO076_09720, partial [Verrucomicrobia bacterium]|nr:hypothetical protein [Verrucomicrobiota bacterium]
IIPLQYIEVQGFNQFQGGLTLNLPIRAILATENQPWSWVTTPSGAFAAAGDNELIFGAALSNVFTYHWRHKVNFAYGNYFSAFTGNTIYQDAPQFTSGVSQQMMKHGFRVSVTPTPDWLYEAYFVYTQFFHTALVSNFYTVGISVGRHLSAEIHGQHVDFGFFSIGAYTDIGNKYNSSHFQLGSAWTF